MKVKCEFCEAEVYEFIKPPVKGERIMAETVRGINGFDSPTNGTPMRCPACGNTLKWSLEKAARLFIA